MREVLGRPHHMPTTNVLATLDAPALAQCERPVQGMTCASCERRIEVALRAVDGVTAASVNLVTARATIQYEPTKTDPGALATRSVAPVTRCRRYLRRSRRA